MSQLETIDGIRFATNGSEQEGHIATGELGRLTEAGCQAGHLRYRLSGSLNERGKPSLRIVVAGEIKLTCQRCLGELNFAVLTDGELELSEDFKSIAEAEDDLDRVLADRAMSVAELVEDEVILALPMVPSHETCAAGITAEPRTVRESPFGVLAGLKRGS
jgi:uncharacterized protein